jgi:hypothetical protein
MLFLKDTLLQTDHFEDNEYLDLYIKLVNDNIQTKYEKFKTQLHHSIPCACYASRSEANKDVHNLKVHLLFKDHVLAHYYLCLCSKESNFKYKMIAAIEFTLGKSKNLANQDIVLALKEWLLNDDAFQTAYEEYAKLRSERLRKPEVREKARQSLLGHDTSEETRRKISEANKGREVSSETRKKISEATKGRQAWNKGATSNIKGRVAIYNLATTELKYISPASVDEYIAVGWVRGNPKISGRTTGTRSRSICCIETGETFPMIKAASRTKQISETSILQCLKGRSKTAGGYHWEYAEADY